MKRTIKLTLAAILAVAAFVSCNKEQVIPQPEIKVDGMRTVRIYSDVPSPTKTTLGENDQPLWVENDEIYVVDFYKSTNTIITRVTDVAEGGKSGKILIPGTIEGAFSAVYPYNAFVSSEKPSSYEGLTDTVFVATVKIYEGIDGKFGKANIAVGKSNYEGTSVQFKNAVALLEVTGLPGAGKLSLSKYKTALVDVSISKSADTLVTCAAEKPQDWADPTLEFDVTSGETYYIPVFPGTKTEELELTFTPTAGGAQVMNLKTGVILKRNVIYPVSWRNAEVSAEQYADIKTKLEDPETYTGIADDVPVQIEMTMKDDEDGDNVIVFPTKADNKAISIALSGTPGTPIEIKNDTNASGPATLIISAPQGTKLNFATPNTHVVINGTSYDMIQGEFSVSTLVISKGVTVASLKLIGGGLEVHGKLTSITIPEDHKPIVVRDCEGLSDDVYNNLKSFIATGYKGVENGGKYDIVPAEGVAKIGSVAYASLEDAIAAVKDGETITLLTNVTDAKGMKVDTKKTFTIDFDGHTYTVNKPGAGSTNTQTQAFQLLKDQTITFKNGIINCAAENRDYTWDKSNASAVKGIAMIIQAYAGLTLENMTIDGTNIAHNGSNVCYMVSSNYGNITFAGNTSIIAPAGDIAFDAYDNKAVDGADNSYPGAPIVTWNSTGSVTGGIELSGGNFVVKKNLAVSVPVMAVGGESTLEIGTGAKLSSASDFNDPNPNLTNHKSTAPVQVKQGAGLTICGEGTVEGINNAYSAVIVSINGDDDTKTAKLTVNGNVTLKGDYYGIAGNGMRHKTEIVVKGGTIEGVHSNDNSGIFHPQAGELTISGGNISGYNSAVEVRGGIVNITGGNLSCTASPLDVDPNGSGSTTKGAALAIAQHTTKKDINVTVNGGTLTGYKAIAIKDAQNNGTANVNVTYKSGTLCGGITLGHGTFTLGGNLEVKEPVKVIGKTTLDLADYTLSAADGFSRTTAGVIIVNRLGDLTVKGNANGVIDAKLVYAAVMMTEKTVDTQDTTNPAKLTVESGSLHGLNYGVVGNGKTGRGNTVITVKGGKIKGTSTESAGIYHPQKGTLTIEGGEIEGSTGIYVKSGDVITSVSAGTIKGTGAQNDYQPCTNGFQSTGDAIVFDNCGYPGGEPNAKISGGTFESTYGAHVGNYGYLPTYKPINIDYTGYSGPTLVVRTNNE